MNPFRTGLTTALVAACLLSIPAKGAPVKPVADFHGFASEDGWTSWSPRSEIAPAFSIDRTGGRDGHGALKIEARNPREFGAWRRRVDGVVPGKTYRFTAYYRSRNVPREQQCISARLEWLDSKGGSVQPPDYVPDVGQEGGWNKIEYATQAPEGAAAVQIRLSLQWSPGGTVWWDGIRLDEESSQPGRTIRAVTIFHRPRSTASAAASVEEFCRLVRQCAAGKPDVICLPEGITVVGTGKSYAEVSEPVPGPTTEKLGSLAREVGAYIVAGIYERVGPVIYNTAVLIDRKGKLAGTYRKTHLPREEVEGGITPGDTYPVFKTDFGTVGLMICWDVQFPEPARAMALQGAELILLPIWGGSEVLARARAIENHVFLVTSSYDMKTFVVDPKGDVLAEATSSSPIATAELHLDRPILQPWLGNMKTRTWKERRPDIPVDPAPSSARR